MSSASVKFEEQNHALLETQRKLLQTQRDFVDCQSGKLESVQQTVKREIKNYSEAVTKNMPVQSLITPAKLKQVVKSAITDDNRLKTVMIFGVDEEVTFNDEAIDNAGCVSDILCYIEKGGKLMKSVDKITRIRDKKEAGPPRPLKVCMRNIESAHLVIKHGKLKLMKSVDKINRIGDKKEAGPPRPLKVSMRNIESAQLVIKNGKLLRQCDAEGYSFDLKRVIISPDRSQEERVARRILVKEMKQKIKDNPSQRYVIKGGKVCVRDE